MWGWNTILAYDRLEPNDLVTKHTKFICCYFIPFKKPLLQIYSDMVLNGVLASIQDVDREPDPIGVEIWKTCAYQIINLADALVFAMMSKPF